LARIGAKNVLVEIHSRAIQEEAVELEKHFIAKYGRVWFNTGTLVNMRSGGDGLAPMTEIGKKSLSDRMKRANPMHNPVTKAKAMEKMRASAYKYAGDKNPSKRPEVRAKLKALWQDESFRERMKAARKGKLKHTEEFKENARKRMLDPNNPMRLTHLRLNSDPAIKEKRIAVIRSDEVRKKISEAGKRRWAKIKGI
jgi:stalled ribosome alternative rescue factor ArfA